MKEKDDKLKVPSLTGRMSTPVPGWATPRDEPGSLRSFFPPIQAAALNTGTASPAIEGYFSPMTKVYIGDVLDHLEMVVSSLDQFVATCDHLTEFVFVCLSLSELRS